MRFYMSCGNHRSRPLGHWWTALSSTASLGVVVVSSEINNPAAKVYGGFHDQGDDFSSREVSIPYP